MARAHGLREIGHYDPRLADMLIAGVRAARPIPLERGIEMIEMEIVIAPAGGQRQADVFTAHWGDIPLATFSHPFLRQRPQAP